MVELVAFITALIPRIFWPWCIQIHVCTHKQTYRSTEILITSNSQWLQ